ncbi:MAG: nucleotidyltransferase domain-containing protein [Dysgonamonadaceae bacterium]|nr:nucleotidyltransferase domain-containing protein [Dysgonamonadaceae bacterium]
MLTNCDESSILYYMDKVVQDEIKKLTKIMAKTVPVEKIYLFGSYAYGTPHKNSDLDFYVVLKPGVTLRPIEAGIRIRMAMSRIQDMPLDVLVNHHDVFFQRLTQPTLESKIVRDGILLYSEDL